MTTEELEDHGYDMLRHPSGDCTCDIDGDWIACGGGEHMSQCEGYSADEYENKQINAAKPLPKECGAWRIKGSRA